MNLERKGGDNHDWGLGLLDARLESCSSCASVSKAGLSKVSPDRPFLVGVACGCCLGQ